MLFRKSVLQRKGNTNKLTKSIAEGSHLLSNFMYIVLLETSGNQRYIFSTNKLRENVGASELTYQVGTTLIEEAIREVEKRNFSVSQIMEESPIGTADSNGKITQTEVVIATSGKALILTSDRSTAEKIVSFITKKALLTISGLTVHGAICKIKNCEKADKSDKAERFHDAVNEVHRRLEAIRHQLPSNAQRFQCLPFVAGCSSSNFPAEKLYVHESVKTKEEEKPHSIVSITKQEKSRDGKNRLEGSVKKIETSLHLADNINVLDRHFKETSWIAVIHADGNGLGQIFLDFQNNAKATSRQDYINKYRKFSLGLDECTINAAASALKNFQDVYRTNLKGKDSIELPAIPLVLGGDDLTLICDGQYAIKFTKNFLNKFVEETKTNQKINDVFPSTISLGICAGIAIIKPHYPFHQAYHLAEQLLQSAKKTKNISTSLSALDYHVLYDSSSFDLDEIRAKFKEFKVARPYIVSDEEQLKPYANDNRVKYRKFSELQIRVGTILEENDGKREIPNTQLHKLRERLHLGNAEANAFARTISHRYSAFKRLFADIDNENLFFEETDENQINHKLTYFLDVMEIAAFWKGFGGDR